MKMMAENFYDMYLEEMREIRPLEAKEREALLVRTASGDQEARSRLVEGSLSEVLELAGEYEGRELPMSDIAQGLIQR